MLYLVNQKPIQLFVHIIAWAIMFGLPFFFIEKGFTHESLTKYIRFCVIPISFAIVFYSNYLFLINNYLFKKHIRLFIIYNILLIGITGIGLQIWHELNIPSGPSPERIIPPIKKWSMNIGFFLRDILSLAFTAGLSIAIKGTYNWYNTEAERQELEKNKVEAELKNLKNQLNPHFLFNTLNNIYALIAISQDKAQQAVLELSKLLRYVLYEDNQHFVSLEKENEFIRNYVELMKLRLSPEISIEIKTEINCNPKIEIAPLLFISLIENAFKHGVSYNQPSFIKIHLYIKNSDTIICKIENSFFPKTEQDKSGSGIGLENLRRRLELLYPQKHKLETGVKGKHYIAELTLQTK